MLGEGNSTANIANLLFVYISADFAGPLYVKESQVSRKRKYVCPQMRRRVWVTWSLQMAKRQMDFCKPSVA